MYQEFSVTTIDIDKATKRIAVGFTNEIDPDSINPKTLYISTGDNGDVVKIRWSVEGHALYVDIVDEIVPNLSYYLFITTDVLNAMGENLTNRCKQEFVIKTDVRNSCEILSPIYDEKFDVNDITITLAELLYSDESNEENSFYVQVSSDWMFENIVTESTFTDRNSAKVHVDKTGQIFIRARVQKDKENYGEWSAPVSIYIGSDENSYTDDIDDDPIFFQELEIISSPEQGETPKSFIIEFDSEVDEKSIENAILILKRRI